MNKQPEDKTLIQQFLQGGRAAESAFELFVSKYGKSIYRQIFRMIRNEDQSKDVLQNVLIKVWLSLPDFREDSSLYTWVYRITRNETLNFLQKEKIRKTVTIEHHIVSIIPGNSYLDQLTPDTISELLLKAIESLPEKQALVFQLKYFEELKYSEISVLTNTTEGALKASYHHAIQKIEEFLLRELNQIKS